VLGILSTQNDCFHDTSSRYQRSGVGRPRLYRGNTKSRPQAVSGVLLVRRIDDLEQSQSWSVLIVTLVQPKRPLPENKLPTSMCMA
jgi:hypothetical protein